MKIIQHITPNIQVQLDRIAELTNAEKLKVETLLKALLTIYPELGEYLEYEQVFIRKDMEKGSNLPISPISIKQVEIKYRDVLQTCLKCRVTQSALIGKCTNCNVHHPLVFDFDLLLVRKDNYDY